MTSGTIAPIRKAASSSLDGSAKRGSFAFEEHAQNGARRGPVPDPLGGTRRTLCAFEEHASSRNTFKDLRTTVNRAFAGMTPLGQSAFLFHLIPPRGRPAFEEHAQNGARRGPVPDPLGGARRTLCAFEANRMRASWDTNGKPWRDLLVPTGMHSFTTAATQSENFNPPAPSFPWTRRRSWWVASKNNCTAFQSHERVIFQRRASPPVPTP